MPRDAWAKSTRKIKIKKLKDIVRNPKARLYEEGKPILPTISKFTGMFKSPIHDTDTHSNILKAIRYDLKRKKPKITIPTVSIQKDH